MTIDENKYLD